MEALGYVPSTISATNITVQNLNKKPASAVYVGHLALTSKGVGSHAIVDVNADQDLKIPANSVVRRVDYVFTTLPTSASSNTGTIAFGVTGTTGRYKAATACTEFENLPVGVVLSGDVYAYDPHQVGTTSETILLTVAGQALTGGRVVVYVYCDAV